MRVRDVDSVCAAAVGRLSRSAVALVALPGVVALGLPLCLALQEPGSGGPVYAGLLPVAAGGLLLGWCVREFHVVGRGTLAPWAPPQHLVTSGPCRFSRNPMYLAVTAILLGWAILFWSRTLLAYAVVVAAAFQLRVVLAEEPWAARSYPADWTQYRRRVPRWLGWTD